MAIFSASYSHKSVSYESTTMTVTKNNKTEQTGKTQLSDTAKNYLSKLKEKYKNVDFRVENFNTDEEASQHMGKTDKEYSCVITPSLLEKMATDEETAAKYEGIISGAGTEFDKIETALGDDAKNVKSYGISVDGDGKVNYYAVLKEGLESFNKHNEKMQERRAEKHQEDKANSAKSRHKVTQVSADSVENLIEKLKETFSGKKNDKYSSNKDGFVFEESNNNKFWNAVGGEKKNDFWNTNNKDNKNNSFWDTVGNNKKDGFYPEEHYNHSKKSNHNSFDDYTRHNAHKSNNKKDAHTPKDFRA